MRTPLAPSHVLRLHHTCTHDLMHRRFDTGGRDGLLVARAIAIVRKEWLVREHFNRGQGRYAGVVMASDSRPMIYQAHVWIRQISPMIWRWLWVRSDRAFADLHHTIQIAFGSIDVHLHRFRLRGKD